LAGQFDEALRLLDQAQELVAATGERMYEAELERLRGVLLPSSGASDRALEIATRQGAEMLVRRIHT
jgi:predicted ATPase